MYHHYTFPSLKGGGPIEGHRRIGSVDGSKSLLTIFGIR